MRAAATALRFLGPLSFAQAAPPASPTTKATRAKVRYDGSVRLRLMLVLLVSACSRAPTTPAPPPAHPVGSFDGQSLYEDRDGGFLVIADGGIVAQRSDGGAWQPVASAGRRIQLDDGSYWVRLGFAAGAEEPRAHWISPAHGR